MTKQFTSASANKYLKNLQDEKSFNLENESKNCTYVLAEGEKAEPPAYSYAATRDQVASLDERMLKVRHAVHLFNVRTVLPQSGITIDEALVLLAQLSQRKNRLAQLRKLSPKERNDGLWARDSRAVEYTYANFDVAQADADYRALCKRISDLQLELDLVNQTKIFEIDV